MTALALKLHTGGGAKPAHIAVRNLTIAGWTGRDRAAVEAHIKELADLGVAPPSRTPIFYRVSSALLTTASQVQALGADSSGEVEFVLLRDEERLLLGVGSDHTDRKAEATGVALSKQLCPKIVAPDVWELAAVEAHWDEVILRSWIVEDGRRTIYQEGTVDRILHPRALLEQYAGADAMFCGTLPTKGGVRWSGEFTMELEDPVLHRSLTHRYTIEALPVER